MSQAEHYLRIRERAQELIWNLEAESEPSPALGYICSYAPLELILAAGLNPVRLSTAGARAYEGTQSYLPPNLCPYVHRMLHAGLRGKHSHLQGTVFVYSCDPMRRLADIWELYLQPNFIHRLDVPRRTDQAALDYFLHVLQDFCSDLQDQTGRRIGEEELRGATSLLNRSRRIMQEMNILRGLPRPGITGEQFQRIAGLACSRSLQRFNQWAFDFLQRSRRDRLKESRNLPRTHRPRVMLAGCVVEDSGLPSLLEEAGMVVATDNLCSGMRHFRGEAEEEGGLKAIASRYLSRVQCPRMWGRRERARDLLLSARQAGCDGVVFHVLKFCDLHQMDFPAQEEALREANLPVLQIEREHLCGEDAGQLRTRIQAFSEMLRGRLEGKRK